MVVDWRAHGGVQVTRPQHEATRALERSIADWIKTYGWREDGRCWSHPLQVGGVSLWDALMLTRANPLRFGAAR